MFLWGPQFLQKKYLFWRIFRGHRIKEGSWILMIHRIPWTSVNAFPSKFNLSIISSIKSKVVSIITFMVSKIVAKLISSFSWSNWRWGRCFLRSSKARLNCSSAGSAISVFFISIISAFTKIGFFDSIASVAWSALTAVRESVIA